MDAPLGYLRRCCDPELGRPDRPVRDHDKVGECRGERDHRAAGTKVPVACTMNPVTVSAAPIRGVRSSFRT
jgi:hypothetical protein